jgi:hypothetical protein
MKADPIWRKASRCHANGTCVEVAADRHPLSGWAWVLIRDAKQPEGPHLTFIHSHWADFVRRIKESR